MKNIFTTEGVVFGYTQTGQLLSVPSVSLTGNCFEELAKKTNTLLCNGLLCDPPIEPNIYGAVMFVFPTDPAYEQILQDTLEEQDCEFFCIGDLTKEEIFNALITTAGEEYPLPSEEVPEGIGRSL